MSEKTKYNIEFALNASPELLYKYISTPSGLSEWFADNVNSRGEKMIFFWGDSQEIAFIKKKSRNKYIKLQWEEDEDTDYYFKLSIQVDKITNDVSLVVNSFTDDLEDSQMFWENQIDQLKKTLGI